MAGVKICQAVNILAPLVLLLQSLSILTLVASLQLSPLASTDVPGQGQALYGIGRWLSADDFSKLEGWGWSATGNPCEEDWQGVACNHRGNVIAVNVANKGLAGSLPPVPELWAGLKALKYFNLAGNSLTGPLPPAITAAGPQLVQIDLTGNSGICGDQVPGFTGLVAYDTNIDQPCPSEQTDPEAEEQNSVAAPHATAAAHDAAEVEELTAAPASAGFTTVHMHEQPATASASMQSVRADPITGESDTEAQATAESEAVTAVDAAPVGEGIAATHADAIAAADVEADTVPDAGADTAADAEPMAAADAEAMAAADAEAMAAADAEAMAAADAEATAAADAKADTAADAEADTAADTAADAGADTVADAEADTAADAEAIAAADAEAILAADAEAIAAADAEAIAAADAEAIAATDAEAMAALDAAAAAGDAEAAAAADKAADVQAEVNADAQWPVQAHMEAEATAQADKKADARSTADPQSPTPALPGRKAEAIAQPQAEMHAEATDPAGAVPSGPAATLTSSTTFQKKKPAQKPSATTVPVVTPHPHQQASLTRASGATAAAAPAPPSAVPVAPADFTNPTTIQIAAGNSRLLSTTAPICGCALHGFASPECDQAVANRCKQAPAGHPMCTGVRGQLAQSSKTVNQLSLVLSSECFPGQSMDTPICTCVQNLMSSDCARARVGLCTRRDPLCIPFQDIFSSDNSSAARAVGVAAAVLDKDCPIPEPVVPGVRASLEFPGVSMAAYISQSYSLTVANALSSVADISSTAVSTVDVRPRAVAPAGSLSAIQAIDGSSKSYLIKTIAIEPSFTAKAIFHHPATAASGLLAAGDNSTGGNSVASSATKRQLLQLPDGINGVQGTYFLRTDDPITVSHKLSAAANEGTLSSRLEQYGIPTEVSGMHIEIYMLPTGQLISTPGSAGVSKASNSSKGNFLDELGTNSIGYALALVAIVAGGAMLCAVLIYAVYRCWRRKQNKQNKQKLISWNSNSKLARKGAMSVTVAAGAESEHQTVAGAAGDAQAADLPTASKPAAGDPPNPNVRRQNLPRCFDYPAPAADFAVRPFFTQQPEICSATSAESSSGEVTPTSDSDAQSCRSTFHQVQPISSTSMLPLAAGAARGQVPGVIRKPNSHQLIAYEHLAGTHQGTNAEYSSKMGNGQLKQQQLASGIAGAALKLPSTASRASAQPSFTRTSSSSAEEASNLVSVSGLNKQAGAAPAYSMGRQAFSTWYHAAAAVVAATMEPTSEVQAEIVAPAAMSKLQSGYTAGTTAAQLPRAGEGQGSSTRKLGRLMSHREALQAEACAAVLAKSPPQAAAKPAAAASNRPVAAGAAPTGRRPSLVGPKWWQY